MELVQKCWCTDADYDEADINCRYGGAGIAYDLATSIYSPKIRIADRQKFRLNR